MDPSEIFFDQLSRRSHEPALRRVTGTVRFDLDHGKESDHWLVTIKKGDISVAQGTSAADSVIHTDRALFNRILTGEANAMASMLRGLLSTEGNPELTVLVQRLFASSDSLEPVGGAANA